MVFWFLISLVKRGLMGEDPTMGLEIWNVATTGFMAYVIFSCITAFGAENFSKYWSKSIYCALGLIVLLIGGSYLLSGISVNDAASSRWMFTLMAIVYAVLMAIIGLSRFIVSYAQQEEWHEPRTKNRKGYK